EDRALRAEQHEQRPVREGRRDEQGAPPLPGPERRGEEGADEGARPRGGEQPRELDRADPEELGLGGQELDVRSREERRRDAERDHPAEDRIVPDEPEPFADRLEERKTGSVFDDRLRPHEEERRDDREIRKRVDDHEPTDAERDDEETADERPDERRAVERG